MPAQAPHTVDRPYMPSYDIAGPTQGQGLLPWAWACERLIRSHDYWLATVWPDGRPHVMPVWGAWLDDAVWCSTSRRSRKFANLDRDPRCTVTTDNAYEPVVLDGLATVIRDEALLRRFLGVSNSKYDTNYEIDFLDPELNAVIAIAPTCVIGLDEADFTGTPTRWKFAAPRVTLREITDANRDAVLALGVAPAQERFVSSVAGALGDAVTYPEGKPWPRAVYADETPVGFVMLSWNVVPDPPRIIGPWFLWKLLIDQRHQRRGYGASVVRLVADIVRAEGGSELLTSYVEGDGEPRPFYERLGFCPTGDRDENNEVILGLDVA